MLFFDNVFFSLSFRLFFIFAHGSSTLHTIPKQYKKKKKARKNNSYLRNTMNIRNNTKKCSSICAIHVENLFVNKRKRRIELISFFFRCFALFCSFRANGMPYLESPFLLLFCVFIHWCLRLTAHIQYQHLFLLFLNFYLQFLNLYVLFVLFHFTANGCKQGCPSSEYKHCYFCWLETF